MGNNKAVITILGTIGGNSKTCEYNPNWNKAKYNSEITEIEQTEDINSLPILIDSFQPKGYEIVSLYTQCAKKIQEQVVINHNKKIVQEYKFNDDWCIKDDKDYDNIFSQIDKLINKYDNVIIDVSHGYRHLPILMIVNTIMHNIDSIEKIEKIIFAKEDKFGEEYTFIDLKRYLDLANISYALTTFDRNYTVANNIKISSDNNFSQLLDDLSSFSEHILANSIDELLKDTNKQKSITTKLINKIDDILNSEDEIFNNLSRLLNKILKHIKEIDNLKNINGYEKLYKLSDNMYQKGYLLNSITLLSEAIGVYCRVEISKLNSELSKKLDEFEQKAISEKNNERVYFKLYELYNQSKAIYSTSNYKGIFLEIYEKQRFNNYKTKEKIQEWNREIYNFTNLIKSDLEKDENIITLIRSIDNIRNNLAHANSSKRLTDVKEDIKDVLVNFKSFCINNNILNSNK